MRIETDNQADLNQRIKILREKGYEEGLVKLVQNSARLQTKFLPIESVLGWLDEQISKVRGSSGTEDKRA